MTRDELVEQQRLVVERLLTYGFLLPYKQGCEAMDAAKAVLAALHSSPVGAEPLNASDQYEADGVWYCAGCHRPVGAEPPSLVALHAKLLNAIGEERRVREARSDGDIDDALLERVGTARVDAYLALLAWTPAQAEPAAQLVSGDAARLENIAGALDKHHERWRWVDAITDLRAIADDMRHPATPSARPTPAVGAESPALSDQFDGWIVYVPNRSFTSVYGLFVGYDEAIAWRCRNGYDADNSHVYPIRRVEADNAAPQPAAVPTEKQP